MNDPEPDTEDLLDRVLRDDPRYPRAAYIFVERALQFYRESHDRAGPGEHISGPEVLEGVRRLALEEYGPMARMVLNSWNLERGEDVGEIVYNLIAVGLMTKTDDDRKEDFHGRMQFDEGLDRESSW